MKRIARIIGYTLAGAAALIALGAVFLTTGPGERAIKGFAEGRVSAILGRRVTVGRLETNLVSRLVLEDVAVFRVENGDTVRHLDLSAARLRYGVGGILTKSLTIDSILVDGVSLAVFRDSTRTFDVPIPARTAGVDTSGRSSFTVEVRHVEVDGADFIYRDTGGAGMSASLSNARISVVLLGDATRRIALSADSAAVTAGGRAVPAAPLALNGALRGGDLSLDSLSISLPGLLLTGNAGAALLPGGVSIRGSLRLAGDPGRGAGIFEDRIPMDFRPVRGHFTADIDVAGTVENPRIAVRMEMPELGMGKFSAQGGIVAARADRDTLVVERFRITAFGGDIEASGKFALDGSGMLNAALRFGGIDMRRLWKVRYGEPSPYSGRVEGTLAASGTLSDPASMSVRADIGMRGVVFMERRIPDFSAHVGFDGARARCTVRQGETEAAIDAVLKDGRLEGEFEADIPDIEPIAALLGLRDVGGSLALAGTVEGPLRSPEIGASFRSIGIRYGEIRIDSIMGHASLREGAVTIRSLSARRDSFGLEAAGRFDTRTEQGMLGLDVFTLPQATVGGAVHADVELAGPLRNPSVRMALEGSRLVYRSVVVDSIGGDVSYEDGTAVVERFDIFVAGSSVSMNATVGLPYDPSGRPAFGRGSAISGGATCDDFDLSVLQPFLPADRTVGGRLSFALRWEGTVGDPVPGGMVKLREGSISAGAGSPILSGIRLDASIADSVIAVDGLSGTIQDHPFGIRGRIVRRMKGRLDLALDLSVSGIDVMSARGIVTPDSLELGLTVERFDLGLLEPFVPDLVELSGMLEARLAVSGPPSGPRIDGRVRAADLRARPAVLKEMFENGVISVRFDRSTVIVDTVYAGFGKGSVFLAGRLTHERGAVDEIDFMLNADRLLFERPKEFSVAVRSAGLQYKGRGDTFLLDGDIMLDETRFVRTIKPQSILPFAQSVDRPGREMPALLGKTRIDVRLRDSEDIWVDNNLARVRLHTELRFVGNPVKPNLSGRVSIAEGYVLFLDRKFRIERGIADFIDPVRPNPIVDLVAVSTVTSYRAMESVPYTITLSISGPIQEAVVELTSDPPLDRTDIVSLLTLGVTREQLTGGDESGTESSVGGVLLERAQALTSHRVSGYLSHSVGGTLGLSQLTIEGNLFKFDGSWGPELVAAKKLSDRVEITYRTNVGHLNDRSILLDYRLTRRFSLQGQTDQLGRSGIDLKYGIRFP